MFFHAKKAQHIWRLSLVCWEGFHNLTKDFKGLWKQICNRDNQAINQSRVELSAFMLWDLWKTRNEWCFNATCISELEVVERSRSELIEFKELQVGKVVQQKVGNSRGRKMKLFQHVRKQVGY